MVWGLWVVEGFRVLGLRELRTYRVLVLGLVGLELAVWNWVKVKMG